MSEFPTDIHYASTHEWVRIEGDRATVGISDFAQSQLGDVVYVELPEIGTQAKQGQEVAVVESVKAASDIYAPVDGEVIEINDALDAEPETVNADPYGNGWFFVIRVGSADIPNELLTAAAYEQLCEEEAG